MVKYLLILILLTGCAAEKRPETYRDRYRKDPEAYHQAIKKLGRQLREMQQYRRYILIDPNFITPKK